MHRFVFSSRAAQPYGRMEIKALCEQSALRNAAGGITGLSCMMAHDSCRRSKGRTFPCSPRSTGYRAIRAITT